MQSLIPSNIHLFQHVISVHEDPCLHIHKSNYLQCPSRSGRWSGAVTSEAAPRELRQVRIMISNKQGWQSAKTVWTLAIVKRHNWQAEATNAEFPGETSQTEFHESLRNPACRLIHLHHEAALLIPECSDKTMLAQHKYHSTKLSLHELCNGAL